MSIEFDDLFRYVPEENFDLSGRELKLFLGKLKGEPLLKEEKLRRADLVRKLSKQFHPNATVMEQLDKREVERRTRIFRDEISHAIQLEDKAGLEVLKALAKREGII